MLEKLFMNEIGYILLSVIIGIFIGSEREYKNKSAGLRTLILVTTGSCIFTILSFKIGGANPDRIAANIITGIGFLGAGAIFKEDNRISGLTTATTIWICAALGMAAGAGQLEIAIIGTAVVLLVLSILKYIEKFIDEKNRTIKYELVYLESSSSLEHYEKLIHSFGLKSGRKSQAKSEGKIRININISGEVKAHEHLMQALLNDNNLLAYSF